MRRVLITSAVLLAVGLSNVASDPVYGSVRIEFSDSVTERDRRLVELGVELAKPIFEANGVPMRATIYVVGDEEYLALLTDNPYPSIAWAHRSTKRIVINVPRIDRLHEGYHRDSLILVLVVHELYHILQYDLGEEMVTDIPPSLTEGSAWIAAGRAIVAGFCQPYPEILEAISAFERVDECPPEFVEENLTEFISPYFEAWDYSRRLYIINKFGVDAYDRYFAAVPEAARQWRDSNPTWVIAFQIAFGQDEFDEYVEWLLENPRDG